MPHISHHAPGAFSWIELGTTDQNAAKHFYGSLLGWTATDNPMGPNEYYTMFEVGGKPVAGGYTLRQDQVSHGVPPNWNLYMAVESADAAVARATELGGRVIAGPFDVYTYGRMAVLADPTGAVFSVWQAKDHVGAGVTGEPGTLCWADLSTPDPATASKFYAALFGYTIMPGDNNYDHIKIGEEFIGGIQPVTQRNPNSPPHWLSYILVENCAASTEKAKSLGANIYMGPMEVMNVGIMTVLADPQGAVFALFQSKGPA